MSSTAKADIIANVLKEEIALRLPLLTIALAYDSDSAPYLRVGSASPGDAGALIKVMPVAWPLAKDVLGNASALVYGPHVIQFGTEANFAGTTDNVADTNTTHQLMQLLGPCIASGCKVEWYESAYGDTPDLADLVASNLKSTFQSLKNPGSGQ